MEPICYRYLITTSRQDRCKVDVCLHPENLAAIGPEGTEPADWTRLGYHRCDNCPLNESEHPHCPLALAVQPLVEELGTVQPHERLEVEVVFKERRVRFSASAVDVLGSLLGLLIATSGCPHTEFFKPMARFHQPYADIDETFYRVASMYRLGQYYRERQGKPHDAAFSGLIERYDAVRVVNLGVKQRLSNALRQDTTVNAIGILDALAMLMSLSLEDSLQDFEKAFGAYLV